MSAAPPAVYYIGLGANLGDRQATLRWALASLASLGTLRGASPIYETAPLAGGPPQPDYLNQAARLESPLPPQALLAALLQLEARAGRVRDPGQRYAARTLDLDVLLLGEHGQGTFESPELQIPHPRLHQRTFALRPLLDLDPTLQHPRLGPLVRLLADWQRQHPDEAPPSLIRVDPEPRVV